MTDHQFLVLWGTVLIASSIQTEEGKRFGRWIGVAACVASWFVP